MPGGDPPSTQRLATWMRLISILIAAFSLLLSAALFFAPQAAAPIWFWNLTPLTARVLAAWLVAIAVFSAQVVWEDDSVRVRPVMIGLAVFGVLQFISLVRYPGDVTWSNPRVWIYPLYLASILIVGAFGWLGMRSGIKVR